MNRAATESRLSYRFLGGCVRVYACDDDDDDDDNFFVKLILGENKYREYQGEYRVVPE